MAGTALRRCVARRAIRLRHLISILHLKDVPFLKEPQQWIRGRDSYAYHQSSVLRVQIQTNQSGGFVSKNFSCATFIAIALNVLGGCTVIPSVQYAAVAKADDMKGMTDAFYRQRNEIEISAAQPPKSSATDDKAKGNDGNGDAAITITSTPKEYVEGGKLGIKAITDWRSSTVVTLNKVENTEIIKSIDVGVTDNTAKAIGDYGGAFVKVLALGAADVVPTATPCIAPEKPVKISLDPVSQDANPAAILPSRKFKGSDGATECVTITLGQLPPDVTPAKNIPFNANTSNYYYSACRDATVEFFQGKKKIVKTVRVAEPNFVQMVQFPPKGTITSHSECGISVKTDAAATDNGAAVINALATQAKAIKDALEAARK